MKRHTPRRIAKGQLTEFAAAFAILLSIVLPLITLAFVPVRYLFCQGIVSERAASLAHCEKRSDVYKALKQDQSWKSSLSKVGVAVSGEEVSFLVTTGDGKSKLVLREGQALPPEWLPDGPKGPFIYSLILSAKCAISSGVISPINATIGSDSQWDNLSPDPKTLKYFIAE